MSLTALFAAMIAAATPMADRDIAAPGPQGPLKGSWTGPEGAKVPVVLMIPGSGPTDRDGNSPRGLKAASLRLLAEGLAARGIASVRIDKRGMFASAGAIADANKVTIDDYAADTRSWIAAIRAKTGAPCVWVLGHSEGGLVALDTAAAGPAGLCGVIAISTPGRPLGEVMRAQFHANPANAPLLPDADRAIDALEAGRTIPAASLTPPLSMIYADAVQPFLINSFAKDPAKLAAATTKPLLIVQGEADLQVTVEDAKILKAAQPKATLVLLPKVSHVLKTVEGDSRGANLATYADPNLPIAPGVVTAVADFITSHPAQ
ncbi:alpha/beta fold hydrolase [Sphingomonas sanguinis]|uniref:Alpha/beta fold hydrolase n=1 Tax=Sphingomonas sanguinis TaxID=33051 RepID=A0ABU5LMR8_9SPHN|nr:alpha/beta fold hydrolase [Sphingomonas sanguinis]MDZ7281229.1 alpha/beta fold hydrolase [Sphingomonas sanguinis]